MGQLWSHYLVNEEEVGKAFSMFNQKRAFIQSDIRGKYKTAFQPHCRNSWEGSPKLLPLPFQRPSLWASYLMAWADIELWMSDWQKKLIKPLIISKLQEDLTLEGINMDSVQRFLVWQWGQPTNLYNEHPVPAWPLVLFLSLLLNDYLEQSWSLEKKKKKKSPPKLADVYWYCWWQYIYTTTKSSCSAEPTLSLHPIKMNANLKALKPYQQTEWETMCAEEADPAMTSCKGAATCFLSLQPQGF